MGITSYMMAENIFYGLDLVKLNLIAKPTQPKISRLRTRRDGGNMVLHSGWRAGDWSRAWHGLQNDWRRSISSVGDPASSEAAAVSVRVGHHYTESLVRALWDPFSKKRSELTVGPSRELIVEAVSRIAERLGRCSGCGDDEER
jgi:hypothetical protein